MKKIYILAIFTFLGLMINLPVSFSADDFLKIAKVVQSFKAENFLGAVDTSIPITVPPGRRGIEPEINISYSSVSGNGGGNLEYQFSIDDNIKQRWPSVSTYSWSTTGVAIGSYRIKFEVRNQAGYDKKEIYIYVAYKPPFPK